MRKFVIALSALSCMHAIASEKESGNPALAGRKSPKPSALKADRKVSSSENAYSGGPLTPQEIRKVRKMIDAYEDAETERQAETRRC